MLCNVQVLLRPDGGGGVRLPARLLALYSTLFDDMFQEMLEDEEADDTSAAAGEPRVVSHAGIPKHKSQCQILLSPVL